MTNIKNYSVYKGFYITDNRKERTYSIYTKQKEFLSTVGYDELDSEIRELEKEL